MKSCHGLEKIDSVESERNVVLDANVIAKWILPGEPWEDQALKLREKLVNGEIEVHEPVLLVYELASLLVRAIRMGRIKSEDGKLAMKLLNKLGIKLYEINLSEGANLIELAENLNITTYDATYISLAKKLKALLISADNEMYTKAKNFVKIKHLKEI